MSTAELIRKARFAIRSTLPTSGIINALRWKSDVRNVAEVAKHAAEESSKSGVPAPHQEQACDC